MKTKLHAIVTDDTFEHVRMRHERFPRVPVRGQVNWTAKGIEVRVLDVKPMPRCGYDRRFEKCSGKFQKHSEVIRVRNILENPKHPPAVKDLEAVGDNAGQLGLKLLNSAGAWIGAIGSG